ncbi:MAG: PhoH family protein, partial [Pseudomonadota bacterium]
GLGPWLLAQGLVSLPAGSSGPQFAALVEWLLWPGVSLMVCSTLASLAAINPWMGALEDNLDVLNKTDDEAGEWGRAATRDLIRSRIKVKSLNFMRGRTFINKFLIIDEAQNLTPKQMKTMITRAGPGTKVVCLGNIAQIDTPYLTEGSSGLTYVVDRMKGWSHSGHVTLMRGERSRLADYAAEAL